jgi:hypothetical protein
VYTNQFWVVTSFIFEFIQIFHWLFFRVQFANGLVENYWPEKNVFLLCLLWKKQFISLSTQWRTQSKSLWLFLKMLLYRSNSLNLCSDFKNENGYHCWSNSCRFSPITVFFSCMRMRAYSKKNPKSIIKQSYQVA